ncbi:MULTISPECIES: hypothetical protein [Paenibacillus]|uniref:Uncharacterized protein n=1 Tax=Paenibacillus rhizophilus TaxID=1850366 RepID=A0A3N9P4L0_9BACL|nr:MULTISPECIES: hypothetical protein [Paenibacillus]RQW11141.1 hypothetical protein EH198_12480 [Paenibacillus rhizophilus]BCG58892.1 hypothetical protein PUR_23170 [Paenibacillus sp. URB8-2]
MSKLDDNERWKSKMLLTEHVEQYEQQHRINPSKIITAEERTMLRDYILLPYMEKMVQKSIAEVEYSTNILKRLYLVAGQYILEQIMKDLYKLRRELKQRNIRILTEEQSDLIVYHHYYCRGYKERFGMTRDVMRSEISLRLTKYTSELTTLLKESLKERNKET